MDTWNLLWQFDTTDAHLHSDPIALSIIIYQFK